MTDIATTMKPPLDQKRCTADEAIAMIQNGQTVAISGFGGMVHPEALVLALEKRFTADGLPRDLTVIHAAGQGDWEGRGLDHLAYEGLIKRWVGGHFATCLKLGELAVAGKFEAYNLPQGVICQLFRDIGAGRAGNITQVGLETFVDPLLEGGKINARCVENLVERVDIGGKTWLWYKAFPIHVGLIRAWAADPLGNLVYDGEAVLNETMAIALAAQSRALKQERGLVIAQVRKLLDKPAPPQQVRVPGCMVDRIVVADSAVHAQTFREDHNGAYYAPMGSAFLSECDAGAFGPPAERDVRRLIAERACDELAAGDIGNLGIGIPDGIGCVARGRGLLDHITLTVESGPIGGMPVAEYSFGAAIHPHAIVEQPTQFDFYDGRGLDFGALGFAQVDRAGNVNVSRFNNRLAGVGGFINISQSARKVVFCGTFTTGGIDVIVEGGKLRVLREGRFRKFLGNVEQVSFSAKRSLETGQRTLYVTERAVFELTPDGLELIEVAPGIRIETQILPLMDFVPVIRRVRPMPAHLFR